MDNGLLSVCPRNESLEPPALVCHESSIVKLKDLMAEYEARADVPLTDETKKAAIMRILLSHLREHFRDFGYEGK